jgi:ribosomal-protein-alanine N-acetyltransferase
MMRVIQTPGFRLEPQTAAHAPAMFDVLADPALYVYENAPPPSPAWLMQRFRRLESRRSADDTEHWLNWVIRVPSGALVGYVQGTVHPDGEAAVAYVLGSAHWGRGLGRAAVRAMLCELTDYYAVVRFSAVLKQANSRSFHLLDALGFRPATAAVTRARGVAGDECLMLRGADEGHREP